MTEWLIDLPNEPATLGLGLALGRSIAAGSIILLEGDLGSGKTTLVKGLGEGLGIVEPIISPTFVLINEYVDGRVPLYHLDLYRLEPIDVQALHIQSYWDGIDFPLGIVAIEWSERLFERPQSYLSIRLVATETGRRATLTSVGEFSLDSSMIFSGVKD